MSIHISHDLISLIVSFIEHDSRLCDLSRASPIFDTMIYAAGIRGLYDQQLDTYINLSPNDTVIKLRNKRLIVLNNQCYRYIDDTQNIKYSSDSMIVSNVVPETVDAYFVDIKNSIVICFGFDYDYKIIKARRVIIEKDVIIVQTYVGKWTLGKNRYQGCPVIYGISDDIYGIDILNRYAIRQSEENFKYEQFDILFQNNEWL